MRNESITSARAYVESWAAGLTFTDAQFFALVEEFSMMKDIAAGFDTAEREIFMDHMARKFAGWPCWPCNSETINARLGCPAEGFKEALVAGHTAWTTAFRQPLKLKGRRLYHHPEGTLFAEVNGWRGRRGGHFRVDFFYQVEGNFKKPDGAEGFAYFKDAVRYARQQAIEGA